jgi:tetratricopeptide (TPR) repeat protein
MLDRQINMQKFEAAASRGRDLYDQLQWEEAVRTWKEALQLKPEDDETRNWISAAEDRLKEEQQIRAELARNLAECERQISAKNFERARRILEESKEKLNTAFRIGDFQQQSAVLADRLNREIEKEKERQAAFHEDLDRAEELMKRQEHRSAKVLIETVLQRDSQLKRARDLLQAVQENIAEQEKRDSGTRPLQIPAEIPTGGTIVLPRERPTWRGWAILGIAAIAIAGIAIWYSIPHEEPAKKIVSRDGEILSKAAALSQNGKLEESFKLLQGYVDQNPQDPKGRQLYTEVKEKLLQRREQQRQQKIQTLLAAAKKQNDSGDFIKASQTIQQVLDVDPFNKPALDQLTEIRRQIAKGQNQALVQQEIESHLTQARQDLAKQRFTQARSQLNQVLQLDPENAQATKLLAEVQQKLKDLEERQDQTAKVKDLMASARNLQTRGQYESAIAALKKVLQLDSENQEAKTLMAQIIKEIQIPKFGEISIICEPFCSVIIDGEELGSSPISRRKIQAGTHTVVVRKPGYEEKRQTVDVKANKPVDLNFTLRKLS